ncbi:RimK/LysX family protein [Nanoarchaeota archaeon]
MVKTTKINGKIVIGLVEQVKINNKSKTHSCLARIDTGATKSSIDSNLAKDLELGPIVASKLVRSAHGKKRRPVIMVKIELTGKNIEEEFTIADRSHMKYPVLIGQNILKDFIIDPSK